MNIKALKADRANWNLQTDDDLTQEYPVEMLRFFESASNVKVHGQPGVHRQQETTGYDGRLKVWYSCDMTDLWRNLQNKWKLHGIRALEFRLEDCDLIQDFQHANIALSYDVLNTLVAQRADDLKLIVDSGSYVPEILTKPKEITPTLEEEFNKLAFTWYNETKMFSFIRQKALHPCYQRIIGMGKDALPFIFREFSKGKGDWFWALESITRLDKNPVPPNSTVKEARAIWLQWGKDNGYFNQ